MGKLVLSSAVLFFILIFIISSSMAADAPNGAALFRKHCSLCHPSAAMMTGRRIVKLMRYPPPGMPTFNNDKLSDSDAAAIADYIRFQIATKFICKAL
jgi:mono/diheme cytochrome c family protein